MSQWTADRVAALAPDPASASAGQSLASTKKWTSCSTRRGLHAALVTLARPDMLEAWLEALTRIANADVHGLIAGRATRLRLDAGPLLRGRILDFNIKC